MSAEHFSTRRDFLKAGITAAGITLVRGADVTAAPLPPKALPPNAYADENANIICLFGKDTRLHCGFNDNLYPQVATDVIRSSPREFAISVSAPELLAVGVGYFPPDGQAKKTIVLPSIPAEIPTAIFPTPDLPDIIFAIDRHGEMIGRPRQVKKAFDIFFENLRHTKA